MNQIQVALYEPKWEEAHMAFANEYFNGRRKRTNHEYVYWKFGKNNLHQSSLLLAIVNERVVGQLGLVSAKMKVNDELYDIHWACDLMVHNNFRGKGIANMLYEEALRMRITLGSDPSPAASKSMVKFGFRPIPGPWKFFLPLRLNSISDKKFKKASPLLKHSNNPILYFIRLKQFLYGNLKLNKITVEEVDWDWYRNKCLRKVPRIEHDKDFFNWRMSAFKDYHQSGLVFQEKNEYLLLCRVSGKICLTGEFLYRNKNYS